MKRFIMLILICGVITMECGCKSESASKYHFYGNMPREVLEAYLSRSITMSYITDSSCQDDDVRMIVNTGAKFIGRAALLWGNPGNDDSHFAKAKALAEKIHAYDPEIILQAGIFEAIYQGVNDVPIPEEVFKEFGLPVENRNFSYDAMLFDDGKFHNFWSAGGSVPDMSKLETRMWFFYRAKRYIDSGYEALHLGQVHLMNQADTDNKGWWDMLNRVRKYASKRARRHFVLCDSHTPGVVNDGKLLFDFHSYPLRVKEVEGKPMEGILEVGYIDSIYCKSKGGITPSGWSCDSLPYLVEVDNWGSSGKGGQANIGGCWIWGYDEICWFARQSEEYRNNWLKYAWDWLKENDKNGHLEIIGSRGLADPIGDVREYKANNKSPQCPNGYNQEDTIKAIWESDK